MPNRRKPYAVKKLEGNRGKRRLVPPVICEPAGNVVCPDWIGEYGTEEWNKAAPRLAAMEPPLLTETTATLFAAYCQAYDQYRKCLVIIEAEGLEGARGSNPAVGLRNKSIEHMLRYAVEFGLTPISREKIRGKQDDKVADDGLIDGDWKPAGQNSKTGDIQLQ